MMTQLACCVHNDDSWLSQFWDGTGSHGLGRDWEPCFSPECLHEDDISGFLARQYSMM